MKFRAEISVVLIAAVIASGCATEHATTWTEYRPSQPVVEKPAPASEVYRLVRWQPIAPLVPATTHATQSGVRHKPAPQLPVELEQVYVPRGRSLGFRRQGGQLLAVADHAVQPLQEAHYEWRTVPGTTAEEDWHSNAKLQQAVGTAALIFIGLAVVGVAFLILHKNRHSKWYEPDDNCDGN